MNMENKLPENLKEVLANNSNSEFWKILKQYIDFAGNTDKFLSINNEFGMKGYWYMKGYISSLRDIVRLVESGKRLIEQKENPKLNER